MSAVALVARHDGPRSVALLTLARARRAFQALEAWLLSDEAQQLPLHEGEREQERRGERFNACCWRPMWRNGGPATWGWRWR